MENEWIKITPLDKAEFVIRSRMITELNATSGTEPAYVYTQTLDGKIADSAISDKEYERLKSVLLQEDPLPVVDIVEPVFAMKPTDKK